MKEYRKLKIKGTMLEKEQLMKHLEKIASNYNVCSKSDKSTYPIPNLLENFKIIQETYNLLNEHLKLGINIHPAGEWLLDNFYIIEEIVKSITKNLKIKKYINFVGIQNGEYKGFARIYLLASQIVEFTENKIEKKDLEDYINAYQKQKTLSMDEIWNIGIFLQIAIIENIKDICIKIYSSQIEKYKVEQIVEKLIENNENKELKFQDKKFERQIFVERKNSFIEYMSYVLKRYGKKGYPYLQILEDVVEKLGLTVSDVIQKEHFNIAVQKVLIGNCITSLKKINRINFLEIFEKINGVEEILKHDPTKVYSKMDYKTKEYYRNKIKEISKKTKISEIYIARKILELANKNFKSSEDNEIDKKSHIGYYLIDKGINDLYKELEINEKVSSNTKKYKNYIAFIFFSTFIISLIMGYILYLKIQNIFLSIISIILFLIPVSEIVLQLTQYILSKVVKPKLVPKMDYSNGIPEDKSTFVVIPTILKSKEKVEEMMKKIEVYYLANRSENLYFALLGDCSQSTKKEESFDDEVIESGIELVDKLNKKYLSNNIPIFNFLYRKRTWNPKEECYLGWERKRGLLNQFNEYLLSENKKIINKNFNVNTIQNFIDISYKENNEKYKKYENILKNIKYIITLDADTDLSLNSGLELIGAMSHILNKPVIDKKRNIVIDGYGIMQPRIGINLDISFKTLFTRIFAGSGGRDSYTNAISDTYFDNFSEGIYTGKGIYDLKIFNKILKNTIPENKVLSHDLLEGSYLRCGLVTDIMLMDGYPIKYTSYMNRLKRWIRGDWQITDWLKKKSPLNLLSKYKIFDNLRRSLFEISIIIAYLFIILIQKIYNTSLIGINLILFTSIIIPLILSLFNSLFNENKEKQKTFAFQIVGLKNSLLRTFLYLGCIPYKAYISACAIVKTIYRNKISHKHLLEWMTSEEAERQESTDLKSYYKNMFINVLFAIFSLYLFLKDNNKILLLLISLFWIVCPGIMWYISREKEDIKKVKLLNENEKNHLLDIARNTWNYFNDYIKEENSYLIPDNYQEDRKEKINNMTSSTNIGLSLMAVISAYDLRFIDLEKCIYLLENILNTIDSLEKWNGHLYNWYNIKTKVPLNPRYISTVDSGNFIGYLYVLKSFLEDLFSKNLNINKNKITSMIKIVNNIINNTDFSYLYNKELKLFSIGFNIEENKLTDSYYDLLASEARQASLIAIAKKNVEAKHWNSLSRTLTSYNNYKGLISWAGTSFEYLMPNINIREYEGSLLKESCIFMLKMQIEYANKLKIPWGITEAAFNLKDLHSNYQYKAFGLPWIGLKRGLEDELVVAPYGSILAIQDFPREVFENIKKLESYGAKGKYGLYESIDFTPERLEKNRKPAIVKTFMSHHQALILLSINNLFNDKILQKRFDENPEIRSVDVLLQERMPKSSILTKENKEKPIKLKYIDYEDYSEETYNKIDNRLIRGDVISNDDYLVAINQKGEGFSKYKNIYINRYKNTDDYPQGIFFYFKSIKSKKIWSSNCSTNTPKYQITFMPDRIKQEMLNDNIKTKIESIISPEDACEIRKVTLENIGSEEEILEVSTYFEPILSSKEQDFAHPSFNNLFLIYDFDEKTNSIIVKRKAKAKNESSYVLGVNLYTDNETIGDLEYEIDKEKFLGKGNISIPQMVESSLPFSKKIGFMTDSCLALKRCIKIKPQEQVTFNLILAIDKEKQKVINNIEKYKKEDNIKKVFDLSRAKNEAQNRYLRIKGSQIKDYQKVMSYICFDNPQKKINLCKLPIRNYEQSDLWKYGISGDLPIILIEIKDINDSYVLKEILKMYEFFRTKNLFTELVILDEEKYSYENYLKEEIESQVLNSQMGYLKNIRGGIFEIQKNEIPKQDIELLEFVSSIIIKASMGDLKNTLKEIEDEYYEKYKNIENEIEDKKSLLIDSNDNINILENNNDLKYFNEYGAFLSDGKKYLISINKENRLPTVWSNIMANEKFGTLVTENMGGYTWYKNSRLNRVSAWSNKPMQDIPSEIIYLKNEDTKKVWSLGMNPTPDNKNYNVIYEFGFTEYIHKSDEIEQILDVFVPQKDSVKINILKLKNMSINKKKIKMWYYLKPVLGEDEIKTNGNLDLKFDKNSNTIIMNNLYNNEFKNMIYVSSSEKINSYTGDKKCFIGGGTLKNPDGTTKIRLNNENSLGVNSCIAYEIEVTLESLSEKDIVFLLGAEESELNCKDISYKYSKIQNCRQELEKVKNNWKEISNKLQVKTPVESFNIILNGWAIYQTIESRLLGRTGYYQSGGAYGFRDQLQDTLGLKYLNPEILKNEIIKHSKHQFIEGDVEHWWHDETKRGIRTKFSDDLLWLPYAILEYIEFTGDYKILDVSTPYLDGKILENNEDERYDKYEESNVYGTIYEHSIKAIERSLNFGENGLPKIGSGDWNDGFSNVGPKGKGESIWLGFFLYNILDRFIPILKIRNDEEKANRYEEIKEKLKKNLNKNGWDGRWYKRAIMDDGNILGSMENDECRIDSIAQSWSVISNAGDNDKKYISIQSLENHLIDKENGIIKLLDPPFEKGKLDPGYIKAYLPGVRENGGQYTHAAVWVIIAEAILGFGDKAGELYRMINPIEHSRTKDASNKYKVEPYVIPADIYGAHNLIGRGGWTWYTGSSSWYYKAGIEYILGFKIKNQFITMEPCIPKNWKEYSICYKWKNSVYNIKVKNPNEKNVGISKIIVNGVESKNKIKLEDNGVYNIEIIM